MQEEQAKHGTQGRDAIQQHHDLPVSQSAIKKLVMDVFPVRGEKRSSSHKTANDGEHGVHKGNAESDDWNRHCDERRSFALLSPGESKGTQGEAEEKAAAITEEDCSRIEIVFEKSKDRPG